MTARADKDPLALYLETYEEAWKTEHEEVKHALWRFEDNLAVGLGLFRAIHSRYWTWRDRIDSGEEYRQEDEAALRERFEGWLRPCREVLRRLELLEAHYGTVEGASEFRRNYREALQILETWETAAEEPIATSAASPRRVGAQPIRSLTLEGGVGELDRLAPPAAESAPLRHRIDDSKVF